MTDEAEKNREFCRHSLTHSLDAARIAYILSLEEGLGLPKELIYAAALLHDLGRAEWYVDGTPHQEAGVRAAESILPGAGFDEEETAMVAEAVRHHRGRDRNMRLPEGGDTCEKLVYVLRKADHLARLCFDCPARKDCYWSPEEKNEEIYY